MRAGPAISVARSSNGAALKIGGDVHVISDSACLDLGLRLLAQAIANSGAPLEVAVAECRADQENLDDEGRSKGFYATIDGLGEVRFTLSDLARAQYRLSALTAIGNA